MSLATTTAQLEDVWQHQTRHNPPTDRWARQHPVLAGSLDDIRARLADRDRSRSGPTLAALVQLATGGDRDAALVVTLALLPRMVAAEACHAGRTGGYDELASHLWEAVVTASNPHTKCLRECLERNAWRRHRHQQRTPRGTVSVDFGPDRVAGVHPHRIASTADTERDALATVQLHATLDWLAANATIHPSTRRLLEQLATDVDPTQPGASSETVRKQRWRTLIRLRAVPGLFGHFAA